VGAQCGATVANPEGVGQEGARTPTSSLPDATYHNVRLIRARDWHLALREDSLFRERAELVETGEVEIQPLLDAGAAYCYPDLYLDLSFGV